MLGQSIQGRPTIPFSEVPDGVYLAKRPSEVLPLFEHYGVLFTGKHGKHFGVDGAPVLVQQTYPSITVDSAENTGVWDLVSKVPPELEGSAVARAFSSFREPGYDLTNNNCEQVARHITEGRKTSTQLVGVGVAIAAVLAILIINSSDD